MNYQTQRFDADTVFTTNNKILLEAYQYKPTLLYLQSKAAKCVPSEDDFVKSEINGFGDTIGSITNRATSMISMRDGFDKDSDEYKTLSYRIDTMILYQQNAIDRIKGIISKPIPRRWISRRDNDDEFGKSIAAEQKPYFFIHRYTTLKSQYQKYIKQAESNCHRRFGMGIDALRSQDELSNEQATFITNYYKYMPINLSPGTMNRICWRVEKEFATIDQCKLPKFDYNMLKTDDTYEQEEYDAINELYKEYIIGVQLILKNVEFNEGSGHDPDSRMLNLVSSFSDGCAEICPDVKKLANILIDICYTTEKSKGFAWEMAGDQIFNNVFEKSGSMSFPVLDDNGDLEYNGKRYMMKTIARDYVDTE